MHTDEERQAAIERIAERDRERIEAIRDRLASDTLREQVSSRPEQQTRMERLEALAAKRRASIEEQKAARERMDRAEAIRKAVNEEAAQHTPPVRRTSGMALTQPAGATVDLRPAQPTKTATVQEEARLDEMDAFTIDLAKRIEQLESAIDLLLDILST